MNWTYKTTGIPDEAFIRGKVPMTKSEVRAITLSKLKLDGNHQVLDIGAGTGSVTIECAHIASGVIAVERNEEGVGLIRDNAKHFALNNIQAIQGLAPSACPDQLFDRIFIGGSGGNIEAIIGYCKSHLNESGILVANTVTIENTYKIMNLLEENGFKDVEVVQVQVSRSKKVGQVHMMMAENMIAVISGRL